MRFYYVAVATAIISCGSPKENKETNQIGITKEVDTKKIELINNTETGYFDEYFELKNKTYSYEIEKGTSSASLNSLIIPIEFNVKKEYPYSELKEQDKFILNIDFLNAEKEVVEELNINSLFETVKYFKVKSIDFKELLNSSQGESREYEFKSFLDDNLSTKFEKEVKYFRFSIRKSTPENQFKNALNSLSKSNQIKLSDYNAGNIRIEYNQQILDDYWNSGKKIEKFLVGEPTRLFSKIANVKSVEITLPFKDKTYVAFVNKSKIEKYSNLKMEDINKDFNLFADIFIYGLKNEKRESFFNKTVIIK